jgi:ribosomal protein S18 acetylase RimI-like enzyme
MIDTVRIIKVDYADPRHARDLVHMLNAYASDPMGGSAPLADSVQRNVVGRLAALPYAFSLLAYADATPVGLVNCFESFSTFMARPIINIHDIMVVQECRGMGIAQQLLGEVETIARAKGCCKLTLEVLSKNTVAQTAYKKFGFAGYELDPATGVALFWQKKLDKT